MFKIMLEGSSWAQFQFMHEQHHPENSLDAPFVHTLGPQLTGAAAHSAFLPNPLIRG